ncbi:aminotransferase class V-fold PLP-dependent enzyme [Wenjunlia tyrosinilytica]|uniref:Aminotransferase class V n=1 Tax=Wenjunlia tyrosinilytica TaxID=1544741 RepID=A0A917ZVF4_9ACTN|nr:aminotransferase class V-fold PLP-dependent enzyme [Wenjunlia tyrosinilytica]GGO96057.1 aminotransferase class V [Wenjunlia tyrosinilytica]
MLDSDFDLARARVETPGVHHVVHLNNAGASLAPQVVVDAVTDHLRTEALVGAYEAAERAQSAIDRAHGGIAELLNCRTEEVAILDSASRAWGMALASIPLMAGDRVLASPVEYGGNHVSLLHLTQRVGALLETLPVDNTGMVDVDELHNQLDERVRLIAVTHVPMHDGLVNPVARIGRLARAHGVLSLVDACQSVGQMPVNVRELDCDLLVGCGRKFLRGPRGTGFLYVRQELAHELTPPILGLDGVEWSSGTYRLAPGARRFETWESNCASRIGLGVAVDYALGWGVDRTWQRVRQLAEGLRRNVAGIPGVTVEDRGRERCGTVALTFEGLRPDRVRAALGRAGINTWVCLPNAACVDMQARRLDSLLRVSVHYYNSQEELDRLCSELESLAVGPPAKVLV